MIPAPLLLAIRLAPILLRLIKLADKYNERVPEEMELGDQVIINNLPTVEKLVRELEFKVFDDEYTDLGR